MTHGKIIKFLIKFCYFIAPLIIVYFGFMYFVVPSILSYNYGPNTEEQITQSFNNALKKDYDLLVLGNSRLYRGVNPERFQIETFNFSHDDDTYIKIFFKLKYLIKNNKDFEYMILGVDYFQFSYMNDSRNYIYGTYFGEDFLKLYGEKDLDKFKMENLKRRFHPVKLKSLTYKKNNIFLKQNGQYIKPGKSKKGQFQKRSAELLPIQREYFEKTLQLAKDNNISVFLLMAPVRDSQMKNYTEYDIQNFQNFINKFSDKYSAFLNYSRDENYDSSDYTDVTHLTPEAADRFQIS